MSESVISHVDPRHWLRIYRNASIEQKDAILGVGLVLPSLVLIAIVILYPLLYNIYLSFHQVPLQGNPVWAGLANYEWLLNNPEFWASLRRTIAFTLLSTTLATAGGLAVTLLLRRQFPGQRLVRGIVLLPFVIPIVAVAFSWRWMFNPVYGVFPHWLQMAGFSELAQLSLLKTDQTALWILGVYEGWRYFPFAFLLIFARAQAIPQDVYEAAKIDGASAFAQFKDITLPELKYIIATVFLLRVIWNFNLFADVWLMTQEFEVLAVFTYETAFTTFQLGHAAVISVVLFVILVMFVLVYVTTFMEEDQ